MNATTSLFALVLALTSPASQSDEEAIKWADSQCSAASATRGVEGMLSCFADDSVSLAKEGTPVQGKAAIREALRKTFEVGVLTWKPLRAEAARSGDLGYSYGTYEFKGTKDGKPVTDAGKYTSVWKKQKDGQWKIIVDVGN